jgi:hypothetical protein
MSGNICTRDSNCSSGRCSTSMAFCSDTSPCPAPQTCVYPEVCLDNVCSDSHITIDYCTGALAALPTPPTK